ncbi:hypothetical protein POM88_027346 [Heracleum sosnowskyi]|uniref:Uncharacterized protein n=1 Tax=Heracleum sosnowskyi TaxID=360622 RepID=A0AAD8I7F9_9APIA|nr:hypothetical protein POM88_027346 [Heracleum sosnowskyi]
MLMSRVTQAGAPLIEITVRDTVDDLRMVSTGVTGCLSVMQVKLSSGQFVDLILRCLPDTTKRHHQWKGLLGRLDWEGSIRILSLNPQTMGNVFILIRTGL